MIRFSGEMLIPTINGEVYYAIYELENWIRRICLSAYVTEFGGCWHDEIPSKLFQKLEFQSRKTLDLKYLGAENDNNFIWSATLGELIILFQNERVSKRLEDIIGYKKDNFIRKIDELREVRNLLAHNRALSPSSEIIIRGIIESLRLAVANFKTKILYKNYEICDDEAKEEIPDYFTANMYKSGWSANFQAFISEDTNLYNIVCLPVNNREKYPSGAKLLHNYQECIDDILSFLINKTGDEFCILISRKNEPEKVKKIIDVFLSKKDNWTHKSFEEQDPRYICNPKIWFYENRIAVHE